MSKKPICVLAGSYRQFQDWMLEHNIAPGEAVYVSLPEHIMGMEFSRVEKIGTWYERPMSDRLAELAATRVR